MLKILNDMSLTIIFSQLNHQLYKLNQLWASKFIPIGIGYGIYSWPYVHRKGAYGSEPYPGADWGGGIGPWPPPSEFQILLQI